MGLPARPPRLRPPDRFRFPVPEEAELGGGLRALLLENHHLPLVNLQVVLRAGLSADPAGQPGAAYGCASLVDEGAGSRSALQLSADLQELGASLTVWAGCDSSNVSLQVLRTHLLRALHLLADVLLRPRMEVGDWRRVREEVMGRGLQRRAEPAEAAALGLGRLVYGRHPYGRPLLPIPDETRALRLASVRRFHQDHYRRDQAVVVAVGDLRAAELQRALGSLLAGWNSGPSFRPARLPAPPHPGGRRLGLIDRPGAPQSALQLGHLCPPRRAVDWAGVKLLNTVLGGSFTSRLNMNLRERHGFTYGVHSSFALTRGPGLFRVSTAVATENTAAALREILRELDWLRQAPVSRTELSKARRLVVESLPEQAETVEDLADDYAALAVHELPLDSIARLPAEVAAVDAGRLQALAQQLLRPEQATLVVAGDAARLRPRLEGLVDEVIALDADGRPLPG